MAQETLKITITADNKDAVSNIQQTITATNNLGNALNRVPQASGQATQALVNLSRVAQDAPYGFIGISNNLNPLLESFQRLSEASKKAGTSLTKELGAALTGPAGIGLAVGVVSAVLVKFGDDISNFISEKLNGLGIAFTKESELLSKSSQDYVKASLDINKLKDSFSDYQNGFITKDKFLKEFNSTLGDTIGKTTDLATAEKFLTQYSDTYVQMTFKKSVANLAAAEAAKKQFEAELTASKPNASLANTFEKIFFEGSNLEKLGKINKEAIIKDANDNIKIFESIRDKYQAQADELQKTLTKVFGAADITRPELKPKKSKLKFEDVVLYDKDLEQQIRDENKKMGLYQEGYKNILGNTFGEQDKPGSKLSFKSGMEEMKKFFEEIQKGFEKADAQTKRFAYSLAYTTTNEIRNMWEAMKKGENVLDALGNAFLKLAEDIAFAIIKAELLKSLEVALDIGTAGATGGSSLGSGLIKLLASLFNGGLAEGGIVTKPTLAMVGEGNQSEAVMPLSKLGSMMQSTFNAGAMASNGGAGNGQFVLRGQDLLVALNRTQKSSALKGQNISLA